MTTFPSQELQRALHEAHELRRQPGMSGLHIRCGGTLFPVLDLRAASFVVQTGQPEWQLRGLADVFDGERHLFQCRITFAYQGHEGVLCDFKRLYTGRARAPLDYAPAPAAPPPQAPAKALAGRLWSRLPKVWARSRGPWQGPGSADLT